jgi:hypothetical protein
MNRNNKLKFVPYNHDPSINYPCVDCHERCHSNDEYFVRDTVWREANTEGRLHRECLERRLGRKLKNSDLVLWPVANGWAFRAGDLATLTKLMNGSPTVARSAKQTAA